MDKKELCRDLIKSLELDNTLNARCKAKAELLDEDFSYFDKSTLENNAKIEKLKLKLATLESEL